MTTPLGLCKGVTKYIYNKVFELRAKRVVERRGPNHPIYDHEMDAENAGLHFLLKESERHPDLKMALGFELRPKWYCIQNGLKEEGDIEFVKEFNPDICLLSDPIDGSKADVPAYESRFGKPIIDGGLYEVFSTVIGFFVDKPTLKEAECCAIQRWDGKQYFANKHEALVGYEGEEAVVKAKPLDEINLRTKLYTAAHYAHAAPIAYFAVETIREELQIPEKQSPGVRSTGSTTYEMLQPTMTKSIAFDIRDEVKRVLEKYGRKMERGAYTHDFAPPGFFAKRADVITLNLDGTELDCNLLEYKTGSYFVSPQGGAGNKILKILQNKVLPKIPEKAEEWIDWYPVSSEN